MSATLSTLSSGMNSSAAAIYEDFLKQSLDGKITDTAATRLNKVFLQTFLDQEFDHLADRHSLRGGFDDISFCC